MSICTKITNFLSCFTKQRNTNINDAESISKSDKEVIFNTWHFLLKANPDLFTKSWINSARNSSSIRKTFNLIDPNTIHLEKEFTKYAAVIEHFFKKLIEVEKLDTIKYETMCIALGKRHCDFLLKGFHVTHWTVFHNCILDVIGETILQAFPNERKQSQIQVSWTRFIARIIQLMQVGFKEEQQARANNCPKQIDNHNCGNKSM